MKRRFPLRADSRGAAAAEMALVAPLLLTIMFGSVEVGNYFYNQHILVKAVRDGARYAGRQDFAYYEDNGAGGTTCNTTPEEPVVADTRTLVMTSLLSGGTNRLANWTATTISLTVTCATIAGIEPLSGIYRDRAVGAPVVTVSAIVPYTPMLAIPFGFSGNGINLIASQQSAVMGL